MQKVKELDSAVRTAALFEPKLSRNSWFFRRKLPDLARAYGADEIALHHTLASRRVIEHATELGLRMLLSLHAITSERSRELREQIASVAPGTIPPPVLRDLPEVKFPEKAPIDMVDAAKIDTTNEASVSK